MPRPQEASKMTSMLTAEALAELEAAGGMNALRRPAVENIGHSNVILTGEGSEARKPWKADPFKDELHRQIDEILELDGQTICKDQESDGSASESSDDSSEAGASNRAN